MIAMSRTEPPLGGPAFDELLSRADLVARDAVPIAATRERVVAVDDVVVCDAPAGQFLGAMTTHPRLAAKVAMVLARQLFELEQVVERTASDPAATRLAELLLRVARRDGTWTAVEGMSEADLARMIGASRETVSRLVADWERQGIVRGRPRLIELADEAALQRLSAGAGDS